jgi:mono/diheme cytochrome c family protein
MRFKRAHALLVIGLLLLGGGQWLRAQDSATPTITPTPAPVELRCDPDEARFRQRELAGLIANFDADLESQPGVALDNLFKLGERYEELALDCGYIPADAAERPVGEDVERILIALEQVSGDPLNGQLLYNSELACAACHETAGGITAPHTAGTYTRVLDARLLEAQFADYTPTQYLVESIVNPNAYTTPGYNPAMPNYYADQVTLQQLADLLAFLESQDGDSPE